MRARTRSPGIAPHTSTTWPLWRASMRPPAVGFSTCSSTTESAALLVRDGREIRSVTEQSVDASSMRLLVRLRRHTDAKRLQLFIGFDGKLPKRAVVALAFQHLDERRIKLSEPLEQRLAPIAANALGSSSGRVELADDDVQNRVKRSIVSSSKRRQPCDDALEMGRKTGPRTWKVRAALPTVPTRTTRLT